MYKCNLNEKAQTKKGDRLLTCLRAHKIVMGLQNERMLLFFDKPLVENC